MLKLIKPIDIAHGDYQVFVVELKKGDPHVYGVYNQRYDVLEYANENLSYIKGWLEEFVIKPEKEKADSEEEIRLPGEKVVPLKKN